MKNLIYIIFEKYGLIKLIAAFVIVALSIALSNIFPYAIIWIWTGIISLGYIVLTFLVMLGYALVNAIRSWFKKK
jgi:hypothetical protein